MYLPDWPSGFIIVSRLRVHALGYPEITKLARSLYKADKLGMIITVAPTVWGRMGKLWQKMTFPLKLPPKHVFEDVKDFFFHQLRQWMPLNAVQQMIYVTFGYKLTIKRMKYWIIRRKYGREPR